MDPISAGIAAVGMLFKGIGGFIGGNKQAAALNAAAQQTLSEAGVNAGVQLQQGDVIAAEGAAQAAANGGGFVGGSSSLGAIQQLASQAMFNARAAVYRGQTEASRLKHQAEVAKAQARLSLLSSFSPAASSLSGGFAQAAQTRQVNQMLSQGGLPGGDAGSGATMAGDSSMDGLF